MTVLTKEQIIGADDLATELLEVPQWGGSVKIRTLTGAEREQLEAEVIQEDGTKNTKHLRAKLVVLSIVNDAGVRMFTLDDIPLLEGKSSLALDAVFAAAQRLSGLGRDSVKENVENLSDGQGDGSISA